jgi:hypothetical protein
MREGLLMAFLTGLACGLPLGCWGALEYFTHIIRSRLRK